MRKTEPTEQDVKRADAENKAQIISGSLSNQLRKAVAARAEPDGTLVITIDAAQADELNALVEDGRKYREIQKNPPVRGGGGQITDSSILRVAGNILSGFALDDADDSKDLELVKRSVKLARDIADHIGKAKK